VAVARLLGYRWPQQEPDRLALLALLAAAFGNDCRAEKQAARQTAERAAYFLQLPLS
jgi:hypothetical protein